MIPVTLSGITVRGPGMPSWPVTRDLLAGDGDLLDASMPSTEIPLLPANERRRLTPLIKLALEVAHAASKKADIDPAVTASVFASSLGDAAITHRLCTAFTLPERPVSPTQFHNSVHNAPAGYWSIATHSLAASTSIAGGEGTFATALVESIVQSRQRKRPVLLVAYDLPAPEPLLGRTPIKQPFAVGFVVSSDEISPSGGTPLLLDPGLREGRPTSLERPRLESLRRDNAAAYSLPLLEAIACRQTSEILLPHSDGLSLALRVEQ
jgi:hypothetical protein